MFEGMVGWQGWASTTLLCCMRGSGLPDVGVKCLRSWGARELSPEVCLGTASVWPWRVCVTERAPMADRAEATLA